MNFTKWNFSGHLGLVTGLLFGMAMSLTPAHADDHSDASGKIAGTWFTQVTVRDCGTGTILRAFPALNTFNSGETMIDTTSGASPSLRSPGQGKWEKIGPQTYSATSIALLFSPAGTWTGTQKLTHHIEINGDQIAFTSTVQIFDSGGTPLSTGCATAIGRRL